MRTRSMQLFVVCALALAPVMAPTDDAAMPTGALWELRALGVAGDGQLEALRQGVRRPVTLAIVGQGGVSRSQLGSLLGEGNTLEYRDGAEDPGSSTHDTGMARVILEITSRLGVQLRLLVYHPGAPFQAVAEDLRLAAGEADIVAFYQSFWGPDVKYINEALREDRRCLLVSPYVEYQSRPTSSCPQALSAKPWGKGLPNFITVAPCAFKAPGRLLTPSAREGDTEVVNLIAPSYYASGAGGTCPSAAVAAAVAAYTMAAANSNLRPGDVVQLMRETVTSDHDTLTASLGFSEEQVTELASQIAALADPATEPMRKLDAPGVLDLWAIHGRLGTPSPTPSSAP